MCPKRLAPTSNKQLFQTGHGLATGQGHALVGRARGRCDRSAARDDIGPGWLRLACGLDLLQRQLGQVHDLGEQACFFTLRK